jgi:hypothetical protein
MSTQAVALPAQLDIVAIHNSIHLKQTLSHQTTGHDTARFLLPLRFQPLTAPATHPQERFPTLARYPEAGN